MAQPRRTEFHKTMTSGNIHKKVKDKIGMT